MGDHNLWWYFHQYRHLAEQGMVKELACPDCHTRYATTLDRRNDDLPKLWCAVCDTAVSPGLDLVAQIQAVVNEHIVD